MSSRSTSACFVLVDLFRDQAQRDVRSRGPRSDVRTVHRDAGGVCRDARAALRGVKVTRQRLVGSEERRATKEEIIVIKQEEQRPVVKQEESTTVREEAHIIKQEHV